MRNVLVALASLVIVFLGALAAAPYLVDWDGWRGNLEEEATRILGRDVRVGGKVRIAFLPAPTFALDNVRIADVEANAGEPLFRAETVTGTLAVTPLFRGLLQANEIILRKPQLHIVLDADGGGNWTTLGQGGRLPFALDAVALDAVRIEGGQLSVYGPDRVERLQVDAIDGELSLAALDGPFRFRGTFGAQAARREVRFASNKQELDGSVRFKAALKLLETNALYNFDARAIDLARAPRFEGELSALVPVPQVDARKAAGEAPVEIKAALAASARAVTLSNLTVAFERQGRPQILTGAADVALTAPVTLDVSLSARWLDLDQIIGAVPTGGSVEPSASGVGEGPIGDLLRLATRLNGFTPEAGRTKLALDVEQATLGREPVSGLRLRLAGQGLETTIQELRLGLPGGARADVTGLMTGTGEETAFDGTVVLRGASLARFTSWSSVGRLTLDPARDGPFAVRARLVAAPGRVQARDFVGDVAGTTVQGELGYRWGGATPEVSVLIEGPQVDLRPILPEPVAPQSASSLIGTLISATAAHPLARGVDGVLRIRSGQVVLPGARYQNVAADVEWREARIRILQMRFAATNGVTVDMSGELPVEATGQTGTLMGTVTADDPTGVRLLADILSVPRDILPNERLVTELAPLRLAGRATFGAAAGTAVTFEGDGEIGGSPVRGRAFLAQGLTRWRLAPIDVSGAVSGAPAAAFIAAITGASGPPAAAQRAQVSLDAIGTPVAGLAGRAAYTSEAGRIALTGHIGDPGSGKPFTFDGEIKIDTPNAADLMTQLGLSRLGVELRGVAVIGTAAITQRWAETQVDRIVLRVGEADVRGQGTVSRSADRLVVDGALATSRISAATLLAWATRPDARTRRSTAAGDNEPIWSAAPFDPTRIAAFGGRVRISAGELVLPTGVVLRDAHFVVNAQPDRIDLSDLEGFGSGGRWSGGAGLKWRTDGAAVTVALRATDVDLATLLGETASPRGISGKFGGVVTMTAQGTSVADLVASLSGRGTVTADATRLTALLPAGIATAIDTAVRGPADAQTATLHRLVREAAAAATPLTVPARVIPVEIKSGQLTAAPIIADADDGGLRAMLALDLSTLRLSGDWRVIVNADAMPPIEWTPVVSAPVAKSPAALPTARPPFPPVIMTFSAPLAAPATRTSMWDTDALERELVVRRAERDVAVLEAKRLVDDARAADESERRAGASTGTGDPPTVAPGPTIPIPAAPRASRPAPAPKPTTRPLSDEERRRIFGDG